jgi:hypothetical protein
MEQKATYLLAVEVLNPERTTAKRSTIPPARPENFCGVYAGDGIEVGAAALENGLPKIDLERTQVQPRTRVVHSKTGGLS